MANQLALVFPLCAKYTIAAAAEPAPVKRARVTYMVVELYYRIENNQDDSAVSCFAPHDVEDGQRYRKKQKGLLSRESRKIIVLGPETNELCKERKGLISCSHGNCTRQGTNKCS